MHYEWGRKAGAPSTRKNGTNFVNRGRSYRPLFLRIFQECGTIGKRGFGFNEDKTEKKDGNSRCSSMTHLRHQQTTPECSGNYRKAHAMRKEGEKRRGGKRAKKRRGLFKLLHQDAKAGV